MLTLFRSVAVLSLAVASVFSPAQDSVSNLTREQVLHDADAIADAQLAAIGDKAAADWIWGVMTCGYADYASVSPNGQHYLEALRTQADKTNWKIGTRKSDGVFADDLAITQAYLALEADAKDQSHLQPIRERLDALVEKIKAEPFDAEHPNSKKLEWWWCDSLFMAPTALARMSAITGDRKYLDAMDTEYWRTIAALYDKQEHLVYRDGSAIAASAKNGQKIFWARGNGWVLAGLARILQFMPLDYSSRPKYAALFKEMADRVATLQQPDGTWHSDLLLPARFNTPETSGTSLFSFAMAWGINQKLLEHDRFAPIITKAWEACIADRRSDGLPGYVQKAAARPGEVMADGTQLYATGSILLTALELQKLLPLPMLAIEKVAASATTKPAVVEPAAGATAFARYVPERMDDIAWENDRIAFRIYGPALQHNPKEHSGSGIDVWVKSVRKLVVNDWYHSKDYHHDHGTGLDMYEVGLSRGAGGLGVWDAGKLWNSKDWVTYKMLDKGLDECGFELTYDPWDANGRKVWETRTMTLKAGSNLNRIESTIHSDQPGDLTIGIGLAVRDGEGKLVEDKDHGVISYWQPSEKTGTIGVGALVDPTAVVGFDKDKDNNIILIKVTPNKPFVYYQGACWDRGLDFKTADQWEQYLREFKRE